MYQNIMLNDHLPAIITYKKGNLRSVCDGSFDPGYGTSAWCIDGDGSIIRGVNMVPIDNDTMDTTRCELAGI